jgi:hypothetical protein
MTMRRTALHHPLVRAREGGGVRVELMVCRGGDRVSPFDVGCKLYEWLTCCRAACVVRERFAGLICFGRAPDAVPRTVSYVLLPR